MSRCATCERDLPSPLDEYGNAAEPLCWNCFSNPEGETTDSDETANLRREIEQCEREIRSLEEEIDMLRFDIRGKRREIEEIESRGKKQVSAQLSAWAGKG